jgi:hypothetical protein
MSNEAGQLPIVETEAGPITMATIDELKVLLRNDSSKLERLGNQVKELEGRIQDQLADMGIQLAYHLTAPPSPDLAGKLDETRALLETHLKLNQQLDELSSRALVGRIGSWAARRRAEADRDRTRDQLHALGVAIASIAMDDDLYAVPGARELLGQQSHLRQELEELRKEAAATSAEVASLQSELKERMSVFGKSGFDPYHAMARLVSEGPTPRQAPLELRRGEVVYFTTDTALARMQRRTRYEGTSQSISIPLGHGFRYRIGGFQGQPVSTQVLSKLDQGTLVVTTQRLVFVGTLKSVMVPLPKILNVEPYKDAIGVFREGRENPEFFLAPNAPEVYFYVEWVLQRFSSEVKA